MFNGERSRNEEDITEVAMNPEKLSDNAVAALENREATDPVASSVWANKGREFLKARGRNSLDVTRVGLVVVAKAVWSILKFAKEAIIKKGQVGFGKGYEIGEDIFSFESKKDKK